MIYLLHFEPSYKHARHYLGYARSAKRRIEHHLNGTGANLPKVAASAGSTILCVRVWRGPLASRTFERMLKNQKNTPRFCPLCNPRRKKLGRLPRREEG